MLGAIQSEVRQMLNLPRSVEFSISRTYRESRDPACRYIQNKTAADWLASGCREWKFLFFESLALPKALKGMVCIDKSGLYSFRYGKM